MQEMGSVFLAKTAEGVRCFFTDEHAMEFLTANGCQIRLDPRLDPKAAAMDVLNQGVEKGLIIPGSIFPIGLQQEQCFLNFCHEWCVHNSLKLQDCILLLDSAYNLLSHFVKTMLAFYHNSDHKVFIWVDEEHPEGHALPDIISLWSANHPDRDFSYARFGADTEVSVLSELSHG